RRGSAAVPSRPALALPGSHWAAADWPNRLAAGCCRRAPASPKGLSIQQKREPRFCTCSMPGSSGMTNCGSPDFLQFTKNSRDVRGVQCADILASDHPVGVDHEGLWDSRRTKRDLNIALPIRTDPLIGIAVACEKCG